MKKTKIFAVLGICLAMGLTACGGNTDSGQPSSGGVVTSSSKCKHDWNDWVPGTPASCTTDGTRSRTCKNCGEVQNGTVTKLGHDFANGVVQSDTATCTADGQKVVKCSRCNETQASFSQAHHTVTFQDVQAGEDTVAYKMGECSKCQKIVIEIKMTESMIHGTNKDDPAGYIKLKNNDEYFEFAFNYNSTAAGKIYQRGVMDAWSSNKSRKVFSGGSNGADDFELKVNNEVINVSSYKSNSWDDIMKGEAQDGNLSAITDVESGIVNLVNGKNTVKYTRKASYNLALTHMVFVVTNTTHEHQAGTEWQKDDANGHYHKCVADGCPLDDYKMDMTPHTFDDGTPVGTPVCGQESQMEYTCTVCGYKETRNVGALDHDFEEVDVKAAAGEGDAKTTAAKILKCKRCNKNAMEWKATGYNEALSKEVEVVEDGAGVKFAKADKLAPADRAAGTPDKTVQGTLYVYNIDVYEAATNAVLSFKIKPYNSYGSPDIFTTQSGDWTTGYVLGEDGETLTASDYRYGLFINGEKVALGPDPYGTDVKGKVGWYDFQAKFDLNKGVNKIEILCLGGYPADAVYDYRLLDLPEYVQEHVHQYSDWMSDGTNHWKVCTDPACPAMLENPNQRFQEEAHASHLEADTENSVAATCENAGKDVKVCSVCGKVVETEIKALGHDWEKDADNCVAPQCGVAGVYAQKCKREGCTATKTEAHHKDVGVYGEKVDSVEKDAETGAVAYDIYNCGTAEHSHSAYVWKAVDYDETLTAARTTANQGKTAPESRDSGNAVRFGDQPQFDGKDATKLGTHLVYKVFIPSDASDYSVLSFYTSKRSEAGGVLKNNLFKVYSGDTSVGYEKNEAGEFYKPDYRYGLRVNGEIVELGYDDYDWAEGKAWYSFPAQISLNKGQVNEIEIYNLGGYRVDMYYFRLSGMPYKTPSHVHSLGDWQSDANNHWKVCSGENCPIEDHIIGKEPHKWNDGEATTPATTSAAGVMTYTCTTCGKTKTEEIPQINLHEWSSADIKAGLTDGNEGSTKCTEKDFNSAIAGVKGYKFNKTAVTSTLTYNVEGEDAVNVKLLYLISVKKDNQSKTGFWTQVDSQEATKPVKCSMTLNGNAVTPPENDVDFTDCITETTVTDSGTLMKPQWKQVATLTLQPGVNTIVLSYVAGGYSFYICGAAIALA